MTLIKQVLYLTFFFLTSSTIAQTQPNLMAITSAQDTVLSSVPDSSRFVQLPPKTIRLYTASLLLQKNLAPNYPGVKFEPSLFNRVNGVESKTDSLFAARELITLYVDQATFHNFSATTSSVNTTYSYRFQVGEGPVKDAGYAGGDLEPVMKSDPEAYEQFKVFRWKRQASAWGWVAFFGGAAGTIAGLNAANAGARDFDPSDPLAEEKKAKPPGVGTWVSLGVWVIGTTYGFYSYSTSHEYLLNAVDIYNHNLLKVKK